MDTRYKIELYRGPNWTLAGTLPFMPVVQQSLERLYGWSLDGMFLKVTVVEVPHESVLAGIPVVENLMPEFGFAYVVVSRDGHVVYQHPHPLDDVVTQVLQETLRRQYPDEVMWGFRLDLPGMPSLDHYRPTPKVQGGFMIRPPVEGEKPKFLYRRVEDPPPPPRRLADSKIVPADHERDAPVKVLVPTTLARELLETRSLSKLVEEGGFLIGLVFEDEESVGTHIVEIRGALSASFTGASLLHFTFTGDSFAEVKQSLRTRDRAERIVGWYHTHLFPATDSMGLSSIDLTLHFNTFRIPWQLAGLINMDLERSARTLRFYRREGDQMIQCPYWSIEDAPETNSNKDSVPGATRANEATTGEDENRQVLGP